LLGLNIVKSYNDFLLFIELQFNPSQYGQTKHGACILLCIQST